MRDRDAIRQRIIEKFRTIARERLSKLNNGIVALEANPADLAVSEEVMREIHTLKGDSKMVGFSDVNLIAHRVEDLLILAQKRSFNFGGGLGDIILKGIDTISILIHKKSGTEEENLELDGFITQSALILNVDERQSIAPPPTESERPAEEPPPPASEESTAVTKERAESLRTNVSDDKFVYIHSDKVNEMSMLLGDMLLTRSRMIRATRDLNGPLSKLSSAENTNAVDDVKKAFLNLQKHISAYEKELADLDEKVRSLRLVPASQLFVRYPRVIRDLAKEQHKQIEFVTLGEHIEADKQVLDRLADPILHLIRNAIDHGIEAPEVREKADKPVAGTITMVARQYGAQIEIEISDDGAGIDFERVVEKARERKLVADEEVGMLTDTMKRELLFAPGLSTKTTVSQLSGRGVGLDVCKQKMEELNGSIYVDSTLGQGTRFVLSAPLAVAVSRLLIVEADNARYAIPSLTIDRVERTTTSEVMTIGGSLGLRVGSEILPFTDISDLMETRKEQQGGQLNVVILRYHNQLLALNVDRIIGELEMIVQPLDPFFKRLKLFSSTVTMVDTDLVPVIAPAEVFRIATEDRRRTVSREIAPVAKDLADKTVLVVDDSDITRELIVEIVSAMGYRVIDAANGEEALSRLSEAHADLILSDIEMPKMDGFELVSQVRARAATRDVPFVILSTRGSEEDKRRAMEQGADAYIVKSEFHEQLLYDTINRYFGEGETAIQ